MIDRYLNSIYSLVYITLFKLKRIRSKYHSGGFRKEVSLIVSKVSSFPKISLYLVDISIFFNYSFLLRVVLLLFVSLIECSLAESNILGCTTFY